MIKTYLGFDEFGLLKMKYEWWEND